MVSGFPSRLKQIQLFNPDVVWCLILKLASVPFLYKQVALLYSAESGSSLKQWNLVSVITTSNWYVYFKQSGVWLNLVLSRGDALRQYHKFKERMRLSYRNLRISNVPGDRLWNENLTNKNSTTQNSPRQYFELPFAHFSEITWRSSFWWISLLMLTAPQSARCFGVLKTTGKVFSWWLREAKLPFIYRKMSKFWVNVAQKMFLVFKMGIKCKWAS